MPDDLESRKAAAWEELKTGQHNPESENDAPVKSDRWCAAHGWIDALKEEALTHGDVDRSTRRP